MHGRRSNEKLDSHAVLGQIRDGIGATLTAGKFVGGVVWDFKSGVNFERPGWREFEKDAPTGVTTGLYNVNISRLSRERVSGLSKLTWLSDLGCDAFFPRDFMIQRARMSIASEWGIACWMLAASEAERIQIAKRAEDAVAEMVNDGFYPGSRGHASKWAFHTLIKEGKRVRVVAREDAPQRFAQLQDIFSNGASADKLTRLLSDWNLDIDLSALLAQAVSRRMIGYGHYGAHEGTKHHREMTVVDEAQFTDVCIAIEMFLDQRTKKQRPLRMLEIGSLATPATAVDALRWEGDSIREEIGLICRACFENDVIALATPHKGASPATDWSDVFRCASGHERRVGSHRLDELAREANHVPRCMCCKQLEGIETSLVKTGGRTRLRVECRICGLEFLSSKELRPSRVVVALAKNQHLPDWGRLDLDLLYPPVDLATRDTAERPSPTRRRAARPKRASPCGPSASEAPMFVQTDLARQWRDEAAPS